MTTLTVNEVAGWKPLLDPGLVQKLEVSVKSVLSVVDGRIAECVFLCQQFECADETPETMLKAFDTYIKADLEKVAANFPVVGALSVPSFMKLQNLPADHFKRLMAAKDEAERNEIMHEIKEPPYRYAVFCFVVVDVGPYDPKVALVRTGLWDKLQTLGLTHSQKEGQLGTVLQLV